MSLRQKYDLKIKNFLKKNKDFFDLNYYEEIAEQYVLLLNYFEDKNITLSTYRSIFKDIYCHSNIEDIFEKVKQYYELSDGFTYEKSVLRYGEDEGKRKWNEYCNRQSETNTLEYKKEKYGWTEKDFEEYNKSRAVTKENLIERQGKIEGLKKWEEYRKRQAYAGISKDYFVEQYGNDEGLKKWKEVNRKKAHNYENYLEKYGDSEIAVQKLEQFFQNIDSPSSTFHSKISQDLFWKLYEQIKHLNIKCYFEELNKEFSKFDHLNYKIRKFDFVLPDLYYCIEFNGDVWHANPQFYSKNDTPKVYKKKNPKLTAEDIWENDRNKNKILTNKGYTVRIVWENEYNKNPENVIENLLQEIYSAYENRQELYS